MAAEQATELNKPNQTVCLFCVCLSLLIRLIIMLPLFTCAAFALPCFFITSFTFLSYFPSSNPFQLFFSFCSFEFAQVQLITYHKKNML
ncbi:uncharacterized protein B0J16DRAFT_103578 [Fusarium flagelliforme]|uniref:uncharacterized protein n=1 Tax=Fusarium flagelliforme TaxID=2675880 RepID=UPI001E8CA4A3|nr:uncharacterized protein B0J16DRAFT_103578 [Fusarium flagelliforme]KAH7188892.1 hypothetical protein B0J16DRAFT_103578 [Fusarium flagelliforme]